MEFIGLLFSALHILRPTRLHIFAKTYAHSANRDRTSLPRRTYIKRLHPRGVAHISPGRGAQRRNPGLPDVLSTALQGWCKNRRRSCPPLTCCAPPVGWKLVKPRYLGLRRRCAPLRPRLICTTPLGSHCRLFCIQIVMHLLYRRLDCTAYLQ